ncbi:MAG: glycosyltransferase family 39 protein [Deltaproteobacteria bacterium]|nr:glycosyltransferase family 39 protein [Deltaproteobacteria bacterium]
MTGGRERGTSLEARDEAGPGAAGRLASLARWIARPGAHVSALAVIAAALGLGGVARVPLDGDPAMYATIARTVLETGEWTHLTFNGVPYVNKPPLHFWVNALVFAAAGRTTFTAVLAPGLLGVACTLLVYALVRRTLGGWEVAFFAALVYVTTPEVAHWSRGVHLETLVTAWVLLGLLAAHRSVAEPSAILGLAIAAIGGWFAKGPQGLFPVAVAVVLWAHSGVLARRVFSRWSALGVVLVFATVGPWLAARLDEGSDFARGYFGGQIGQVLLEPSTLGRGPFWYFSKLARTYWPWLPVAAVGLVLLGRAGRTSLGARLWLVYGAIVLVVISAAAGKKSRYLFQLYPALAAAAGFALHRAARRVRALPVALLGAAAIAALVVVIVGEHVSRSQREHSASGLAIAAALPRDRPVWLTHAVQYGEPQLGKIIGFYGPALLRTCRVRCAEEAEPGAAIVAREQEAERVAREVGAEIRVRHGILALLERPPAPAVR